MALTESPIIGNEAKAYENTGTYGVPVWTEVKKVIDVDIGLGKGEADIPSRETKFELKRVALRQHEVTATYRKKQGADARFDSWRGAYHSDTIKDLLFLDGASTETGAQGMRGFYQCFDMSISQANTDAESANFVWKPTYKEESGAHVDPVWFIVP